MKLFFVVALAVLTVLASADDSDVLEFNEDNFDAEIAKHDITLVEFFAPWCGHCKKLAPEYEKAATELKNNIPPVPLAKVDCTANSGVCSKFGVSGYPTLKIFRGGELSADYSGPREAGGIVKYMSKQAGPSAQEVKTVEVLETISGGTEHTIVGFFASEDSAMKKAFLSAAGSLRDSFKFMHTSSAEVLEKYGYNDHVVIFQPGKLQTKLEDVQKVYEGETKSAKVTSFVKENFMGLAGLRTMDNMAFFDSKKPLVVVYYEVDYERNPKGSNYWRNRVIKVAKEFVGKLSFSVSNKAEFGHEIGEFGPGSDAEVFAGIFSADGKKYSYGEKKFSVDGLKEFAKQFLNGELTPYMKSEPVPEDNDGPVKIVVGANFDEIVNDPTKDVLLEFYAPWCGHCKSLAPKYDQLGEKLKDDPNIVIAKIDATANDYPSMYQVKGYPTIFWKPAGKEDQPESYQGGREVADFVEFIKRKATNPLVLPAEEKKSKKKKKSDNKEEL